MYATISLYEHSSVIHAGYSRRTDQVNSLTNLYYYLHQDQFRNTCFSKVNVLLSCKIDSMAAFPKRYGRGWGGGGWGCMVSNQLVFLGGW